MTVLRTFVLRSPEQASAMVAFVKQHAASMVAAKTPLQVTVAKHRATRSNEQNAFMWAGVLTPIAEQACIAGRWFSAETWHEYLKAKFLPENSASGVAKWEHMPDGQRRMVMSTTDLNTEEMNLYVTAIQAHAAGELGVHFD